MAHHDTNLIEKLDSRSLAPRDLAAARDAWGGELRRKARFLGERDRLMLRLFHERQLTYEQIARRMGQNRGTIFRRLQIVRRRLTGPVADGLTGGRCRLPEHLREMGVRRFIRGETIARLAKDYNLSVHHAREQLYVIRGWVLREAGEAIERDVIQRDARLDAEKALESE